MTTLEIGRDMTPELLLLRTGDEKNTALAEIRAGSADDVEFIVTTGNTAIEKARAEVQPRFQGQAIEAIRARLRAELEKRMRPRLTRLDKVTTASEHVISDDVRLRPDQGVSLDDVARVAPEIRQVFAGLTQAQRDERYLAAAHDGDWQTCRALELVPGPLLLISQDALAEGREALAEARYPEEYNELQEWRSVRDAVNGMHRFALGQLGDDPVLSRLG